MREDGLREMLAARGPQAKELGWKTYQEDKLDNDDNEEENKEAEAELAEGKSAKKDIRVRMER